MDKNHKRYFKFAFYTQNDLTTSNLKYDPKNDNIYTKHKHFLTSKSHFKGDIKGTYHRIRIPSSVVVNKFLVGYTPLPPGPITSNDTILTAIGKLASGGSSTITLTGDVTGTGTGTIPTTLSNLAVINQPLTGFIPSSGPITPSDSILIAIEKLAGGVTANGITSLYGDVVPVSGPGSVAVTLNSVNSTPGTFGNSIDIPVITVNNKGLITNITTITLTSTNIPNTVVVRDNTGKIYVSNIKISSLSNGILHSDNFGDITSSPIVNSDIAGGANIDYSKLNLANSITNGDISLTAAIQYSKLNLANSITNGDISPTAAIVYTKLNLANSIKNNDISPTANIANSKLAGNPTSLDIPDTIMLRDINGDTNVTSITYSTSTRLSQYQNGMLIYKNLASFLGPQSIVKDRNVLYVRPAGTQGPDEYSIISAALLAIGTTLPPSSLSNTYVISVSPGIYLDTNIICKPYVSILGSSFNTTLIVNSTPSQHLFIGYPLCLIDNMFLTSTGMNAGKALIYLNVQTPQSGVTIMGISNCWFGTSDILVWVDESNITANNLLINNCYYGVNQSFNIGFKLTSNLFPSTLIMYSTGTTYMNTQPTDVFYLDGTSVYLNINTHTSNTDLISGQTANFLTILGGAQVDGSDLNIFGFNKGINNPSDGTTPFLNLSNCVFRNNVLDISIQNILTVMSFTGKATYSKINVVSTNQTSSWSFIDLDTGALEITDTLFVTQPQKTHTEILQLAANQGVGLISGGAINSSPSSLTVTITPFVGYYINSVNEVAKIITTTNTNVSLPANSQTYIFIDSNGIMNTSPTEPAESTTMTFGRVGTNGTGVFFVDATSTPLSNETSNYGIIAREIAGGAQYVSGSIVSAGTLNPLAITVTNGEYYVGAVEFLPSGGTTDILIPTLKMSAFYLDNLNNWIIIPNITTIDNTQYNPPVPGNLQPIPAGQYVKHALYIVGDGVNEQYFFVYGQVTFPGPTPVLAQSGVLPTPPTYFFNGITLIASFIMQQGVSTIVEILSERRLPLTQTSATAPITQHAALFGLTNGDAGHTQFYMLNGSKPMIGPLDMGGQAIQNTLYTTPGIIHNDGSGNFSTSLINNGDIIVGAGITYNKLNLANSIQTTDLTTNSVILDRFDNTGTLGFLLQANGPGFNSSWVNPSSLSVGTSTNFSGSLLGDVIGTQLATLIANNAVTTIKVNNNAITLAKFDNTGTLSFLLQANGAGNNSSWVNPSSVTVGTSTNFSGSLSGDVSGTQSSTLINNNAITTSKVNNNAIILAKFDNTGTLGYLLQGNGAGNNSSWVNPSSVTVGTSTNFTGTLMGDVSGTQNSTVIQPNVVTLNKFDNTGNNGFLLMANGSGNDSSWTNPSTLSVGTATNVTGVVNIANGGTGQTTQQAALNALAGGVTSGHYLRGNGTNVVLSTIQVADVPTLNQNTTGTASNVTGIIAIINGGTGATTANSAFNNLSPMTTLGDMIYGALSGIGTRLAGNTTTTKRFLTQTGNGTISAAPGWNTILAADVPILNQNTTGSAASFTGSLAGDVTGTQSATTVGKIQGISVLAGTPSNGQVLTYDSTNTRWAAATPSTNTPTITKLASNFTNLTPTLTPVITAAVTPGNTYKYEYTLMYNINNTGHAIKVSLTYPTVTVGSASVQIHTGAAGTAECVNFSITASGGSVLSTSNVASASAVYIIRIIGIIVPTVSGFLTVNCGLDNASGGPILTVYAGSYISIQAI